nr:MAG TPA: hypothetical protein [Microviridae sp.]
MKHILSEIIKWGGWVVAVIQSLLDNNMIN